MWAFKEASIEFPEKMKTRGLNSSLVKNVSKSEDRNWLCSIRDRRTCVSMTAGKLKTEFKKFLTVRVVTQKTHCRCDLWKLLLWRIESRGWTAVLGTFSAWFLWAAGLTWSKRSLEVPLSFQNHVVFYFIYCIVAGNTCGQQRITRKWGPAGCRGWSVFTDLQPNHTSSLV